MSFFNSVERVVYRKKTEDPVILLQYIKFTDEKANEKYLLFKFKNNLTQRLKDMSVLVNLYDENNFLIGVTKFEYKNFVAKGLEEFAPTAKLLVNYNTKYIEVKVVRALFDTLVWEEETLKALERVSFENEVVLDHKKEKSSKKVEVQKAPRGSRKTKYKDVSKANRVVFPKVLTSILVLLLIGVTIFGVYYVKGGSGSLSDGNFEYEILNKDEIVITSYLGNDSNITIPEMYKSYNVVSIETDAFKDSSVEIVNFNGGDIELKSNAFNNCESLIEINDLNGAVKVVNNEAFNFCPVLSSVIMPNAIILEDAFVDCNSITKLSIYEIDGDELSITGVTSSLESLSIYYATINSYFFYGYSRITQLELLGDATVQKNGFKSINLRTIVIGKDAYVPPAALADFNNLYVSLHAENIYDETDYLKQNYNLIIGTFE